MTDKAGGAWATPGTGGYPYRPLDGVYADTRVPNQPLLTQRVSLPGSEAGYSTRTQVATPENYVGHL